MKNDERMLLDELQRQAKEKLPYPREVVRDLCMNEKRAAYICKKWTKKGWYDYGVHVLAGWLTPEGMTV